MMPKTVFFLKVRGISDTNIDTVNMVELKDRLKEGQSPMAKKSGNLPSYLALSRIGNGMYIPI